MLHIGSGCLVQTQYVSGRIGVSLNAYGRSRSVLIGVQAMHRSLAVGTHLSRVGGVCRQQRDGRFSLFKPFHGERSLLHLLHEPRVRAIADNSTKLCPVVPHDAGPVNNHVVHKPFAGLIPLQANTPEELGGAHVLTGNLTRYQSSGLPSWF